MTENLFSYGTLQTEALQHELFGRRLEGRTDVLVGYLLQMIEIQDQHFVIKSGTAHHRNPQFTGDESDYVEGTALALTDREVDQADAYEPPSYTRVLVKLKSGLTAWVYLDQTQLPK